MLISRVLCCFFHSNLASQMSHITRKPDFRVCDQFRLKSACSAKQTSYSFKILAISRQGTIKVLIRLHRCANWSVPLLFAYGKRRFSHDVAQIGAAKVEDLEKPPAGHLQAECNRLTYGPNGPLSQRKLLLIQILEKVGVGSWVLFFNFYFWAIHQRANS